MCTLLNKIKKSNFNNNIVHDLISFPNSSQFFTIFIFDNIYKTKKVFKLLINTSVLKNLQNKKIVKTMTRIINNINNKHKLLINTI